MGGSVTAYGFNSLPGIFTWHSRTTITDQQAHGHDLEGIGDGRMGRSITCILVRPFPSLLLHLGALENTSKNQQYSHEQNFPS
jgi:hypothetical protein